MSRPLRATPQPLSYSLAGAALATGMSESSLGRIIKAGDLTVRYPNTSPVILAAELQAYLESLPFEKPNA